MPPEVIDTPVAQEPAVPSLRETLEKAVEANPITAPAPDRSTPEQAQFNPAAETPAQAEQRERDAQGRFTAKQQAEAAKARDGATVPTDKEVKAAEQPLPGEEHQPEAAPNIDNAPKSWKAGVREKWANLDPEVRAEVHRRERDMAKFTNEAAPIRKFASDFQQVIQQHAQRYAPTGMQPLEVVSNLMAADALLSTAPMAQRASFMAKLISDYGIDINALDSALAGEDPGTQPQAQLESLIDKKLAPIQEFVQTTQQRRDQAIRQEYSEQEKLIEQMANDEVNFPHLNTVAQDMADIMELNSRRKVYLSPQEAYKRAVAMNPEAQAAEQGRAGQQRARQAHDAATRSLGASLSVSGSAAGLKQDVAPSDLRGTIEAAWAAAHGR